MAVNANSIPTPGVSRWTRQDIEQAVEGLISLLDALDGDPDFEDTDEDNGCEDEGIDADTEADSADTEPSLGWCEYTPVFTDGCANENL